MHDGELLDFVVRDGQDGAAAVGNGARAERDEYPVSALLRVREGGSARVWVVEYAQCRRASLDFPGVRLFHEDGSGFGDWGYHELSDAGDGFLRHEVLFASGSSILVEFLTAIVRHSD